MMPTFNGFTLASDHGLRVLLEDGDCEDVLLVLGVGELLAPAGLVDAELGGEGEKVPEVEANAEVVVLGDVDLEAVSVAEVEGLIAPLGDTKADAEALVDVVGIEDVNGVML